MIFQLGLVLLASVLTNAFKVTECRTKPVPKLIDNARKPPFTETSSGDEFEPPVEVHELNNDSVSFVLKNVWPSSGNVVSGLYAQFEKAGSSESVCAMVSNVRFGTVTNEYMASCVDGFAKVIVFVEDEEFFDIRWDTVDLPELCGGNPNKKDLISLSSPLRTVLYEFEVPCSCEPDMAKVKQSNVITNARSLSTEDCSMPLTLFYHVDPDRRLVSEP